MKGAAAEYKFVWRPEQQAMHKAIASSSFATFQAENRGAFM
jgi:hypothetical protein